MFSYIFSSNTITYQVWPNFKNRISASYKSVFLASFCLASTFLPNVHIPSSEVPPCLLPAAISFDQQPSSYVDWSSSTFSSTKPVCPKLVSSFCLQGPHQTDTHFQTHSTLLSLFPRFSSKPCFKTSHNQKKMKNWHSVSSS